MKFDAPIPGANYTSDTRQYPWHRKPDIEDYDEAVDYLTSRLQTSQGSGMINSMLEVDMPIAAITSTIVLQAISKGKMQIDMGVVTAGPLARHIELLAKRNGLKYEMGADEDDSLTMTPMQLRMTMAAMGRNKTKEPIPEAAPVEAEPTDTGLMAKPEPTEVSATQQQEMLGNVEEDSTDGLA